MLTNPSFAGLTATFRTIITELIDCSKLRPNDILVVGCSTSEIIGQRIGTARTPELARELVDALLTIASERNIFIAAQCCEHLGRTLIVERQAMFLHRLAQVNVVPIPTAGGAFATACYAQMTDPVAVSRIKAQAGIDIGQTLIGMHMADVAVPLRLQLNRLGEAIITACRVRPPFVGGTRAQYDERLL